jgi:hypothetical protein
VRELQNI